MCLHLPDKFFRVCWNEPIIYVSAELFRVDGVLLPFVDMVDGVVEEVFVVVYSCDVEWRGCGVLG